MDMKRICKNRNRTVLNHIRNNLVNPDLLVNQLWMQEEDKNGVKIIELNSSSDSSKESSVKFNHAWSYVNNDTFEEEENNYTVNEDARRRRRMNMNNNENNFNNAYTNQHYLDRDMQSNSNSFYETYDSGINSRHMHQMNCFTIVNNQHFNSDSSTDNENYEAIEIIEVDTAKENKHWDHVYNEEVTTYDPHTQSEKRTIWIYSYKNKPILSENDFELANIPCIDIDNSSTSTSCSLSDEEQRSDKSTNICRLGSPIPATYLPRLDLSLVQTLSTVTELSEPNKAQSKESSQEKINLKPRNNWLSDKNVKQNEKYNIVDWMALSPRERRRRSINTNLDTATAKDVVKQSEVTYAEGGQQLDQVSIKSGKVVTSTVQVQVDIHASEKEIDKELLSVPMSSNDESKPDGIKKIADILPMEISFADVDNDVESINAEFDFFIKPSIQISPYVKINKTEITDPIEKLNCNNWISEESIEKQTTVYDYYLEDTVEVNAKDSSFENVDSASKRLWMKNLQLMKPPQWVEYLPITGSPPSLHLSLSSLDPKKTWFKRLAECVICCK